MASDKDSIQIQLYNEKNIDKLPWAKTEKEEQVKNFLTPLVKNGVSQYIENIETKLIILTVDDLIIPVTINEAQYDNSYVCSPYGQYVSCATESFEMIDRKVLKWTLSALVWGLGKVLSLGHINKVVIVNNWLFSTNLYPSITHEQIKAITDYLKNLFPQYAIIFRSVNTYQDSQLFNGLTNQDYSLIASRQIYFLNVHNDSVFSSRILKSDRKLLRDSEYEILENNEISLSETERILDLYRAVYLDKHSKHNPQITSQFVSLALKNELLQLRALKKDGQLDAVAGYFSCNGVMISPFLGYDTHHVEKKLYRLMCTVLALEAKKTGTLFNLSSGAVFFKKIRKAESHLEYMAVYHHHLSLGRRLPWMFLKTLANSIGVAFMKYHEKLSCGSNVM